MTAGGLKLVLVDDSATALGFARAQLEEAGHQVVTIDDSRVAMERLRKERPDIILLDIMMPHVNGFQLCSQIRQDDILASTPIIVASAKTYDSDKQKAKRLGANGYIVKPFSMEQFDKALQALQTMQISTWGVRGTLPMPQEGYIQYGGHTSCYSLQFSPDHYFVFDAGTGIKNLSNHLMREGRKRLNVDLFITHPHWDHINGFPYFVPTYLPGNEIRIYGTRQDEATFEEMIMAQMDGTYFPVTAREFSARVSYREIGEEKLNVDGIRVSTLMLKHPGHCLGYRVDYQGRSVCYITDNELYPADSDFADEEFMHQLADFCHGTNILIHDSTYFDEEYLQHLHWGHSSLSEVCRLAHLAKAERLWIHHHDPDQDDCAIERKLDFCQSKLDELGAETRAVLPLEGTSEPV